MTLVKNVHINPWFAPLILLLAVLQIYGLMTPMLHLLATSQFFGFSMN